MFAHVALRKRPADDRGRPVALAHLDLAEASPARSSFEGLLEAIHPPTSSRGSAHPALHPYHLALPRPSAAPLHCVVLCSHHQHLIPCSGCATLPKRNEQAAFDSKAKPALSCLGCKSLCRVKQTATLSLSGTQSKENESHHTIHIHTCRP